GDCTFIHIIVVEVFTGHSPDKRIVTRSCTRVNRPWWRNNSLLVFHPNVAGFISWSHKVRNSLIFWQVEIEVYFHTSIVRVRRHGVPNGTWLKLCHSHLQLA